METGGSSKETGWCKNPIQLHFLALNKTNLNVLAVMCSFHGTVDCKFQDKLHLC